MNEIDAANKFLLEKASEIYKVPLDLLERTYQLGHSSGYYDAKKENVK